MYLDMQAAIRLDWVTLGAHGFKLMYDKLL
jgi:hypothetical protein